MLKIGRGKFAEASTRREMTSQLASQFDPLGGFSATSGRKTDSAKSCSVGR